MTNEEFMELMNVTVSAFADEPPEVQTEFVRQLRSTGVSRDQITAWLVQKRLSRKAGELRPTMSQVLSKARTLAMQGDGASTTPKGSVAEWYRSVFQPHERMRLARDLETGFTFEQPIGMMMTDLEDGIVTADDLRLCMRLAPIDDPGRFQRLLFNIAEPRRVRSERFENRHPITFRAFVKACAEAVVRDPASDAMIFAEEAAILSRENN